MQIFGGQTSCIMGNEEMANTGNGSYHVESIEDVLLTTPEGRYLIRCFGV